MAWFVRRLVPPRPSVAPGTAPFETPGRREDVTCRRSRPATGRVAARRAVGHPAGPCVLATRTAPDAQDAHEQDAHARTDTDPAIGAKVGGRFPVPPMLQACLHPTLGHAAT